MSEYLQNYPTGLISLEKENALSLTYRPLSIFNRML